jgi:hypothetical protein
MSITKGQSLGVKRVGASQSTLEKWLAPSRPGHLVVYCCNLERAVAAVEGGAVMPSGVQLA